MNNINELYIIEGWNAIENRKNKKKFLFLCIHIKIKITHALLLATFNVDSKRFGKKTRKNTLVLEGKSKIQKEYGKGNNQEGGIIFRCLEAGRFAGE